jgi:hypothetical protein
MSAQHWYSFIRRNHAFEKNKTITIMEADARHATHIGPTGRTQEMDTLLSCDLRVATDDEKGEADSPFSKGQADEKLACDCENNSM